MRFRSESAAASLKHGVLSRHPSRIGSFRSESAAASLKQLRMLLDGRLHRLFPQRIRCGLIEA